MRTQLIAEYLIREGFGKLTGPTTIRLNDSALELLGIRVNLDDKGRVTEAWRHGLLMYTHDAETTREILSRTELSLTTGRWYCAASADFKSIRGAIADVKRVLRALL